MPDPEVFNMPMEFGLELHTIARWEESAFRRLWLPAQPPCRAAGGHNRASSLLQWFLNHTEEETGYDREQDYSRFTASCSD